jgi:hypothetical protein
MTVAAAESDSASVESLFHCIQPISGKRQVQILSATSNAYSVTTVSGHDAVRTEIVNYHFKTQRHLSPTSSYWAMTDINNEPWTSSDYLRRT